MENKDFSISRLRVLSMIMIVLYHCLCYTCGIWHEFNKIDRGPYINFAHDLTYIGLNTFVFISGFLFALQIRMGKYKDVKKFALNKFRRLFIPYISWGIVQIIVLPMIYTPKNFLFMMGHLWFLLMLFNIFIIAYLIKAKCKSTSIKEDIIILISFIIISKLNSYFHILPRDGDISIFMLDATLRYMLIFLLGIYTVKYDIVKRLKFNNIYLIGGSIICIFIINLYLPKSSSGSLVYGWIVLSILIINSLILLKDVKIELLIGGKKLLSILDSNSMGIYIIHHILLQTSLQYYLPMRLFLDTHYLLGPFLLFLIVFILSFLISYIFNKFTITKKMLGSK